MIIFHHSNSKTHILLEPPPTTLVFMDINPGFHGHQSIDLSYYVLMMLFALESRFQTHPQQVLV